MLVFVNNVGAYCYQFTVNPGPGTAGGRGAASPAGSVLHSNGRVLGAWALCLGSGGALVLLLVGMRWEDGYPLSASLLLGVSTSLVGRSGASAREREVVHF